jgi:hypothetical protein
MIIGARPTVARSHAIAHRVESPLPAAVSAVEYPVAAKERFQKTKAFMMDHFKLQGAQTL